MIEAHQAHLIKFQSVIPGSRHKVIMVFIPKCRVAFVFNIHIVSVLGNVLIETNACDFRSVNSLRSDILVTLLFTAKALNREIVRPKGSEEKDDNAPDDDSLFMPLSHVTAAHPSRLGYENLILLCCHSQNRPSDCNARFRAAAAGRGRGSGRWPPASGKTVWQRDRRLARKSRTPSPARQAPPP